MSAPIRVAVVGTGGIAEAHLYAYQRAEDRAQLVAVVDIVEERARRAAATFGVPDISTFAEVLARPDVDAVSICTPPSVHVQLSVAALNAGKHVLCEKPVSATLSGLDEIAEAARASGKVFSGVFQLRFGKGAQQLRSLVDDGRMGRLHLGIADTLWHRDAAYFSVPWRATWADQCGGVQVSQAVHLIDALLWYLGKPVSVFAHSTSFRGLTECEETSSALVRFESGAIGQVTSTVTAFGPEKSRLEIYGTELSAVSSGPVYEATAEPFAIGAEDTNRALAIEHELEERVPKGFRMLHRGQVEDFVAAVQDSQTPLIGIPECREALQVTTAIYKSSMTGAAVTLPLAPDDPWYSALPPAGFGLI